MPTSSGSAVQYLHAFLHHTRDAIDMVKCFFCPGLLSFVRIPSAADAALHSPVSPIHASTIGNLIFSYLIEVSTELFPEAPK